VPKLLFQRANSGEIQDEYTFGRAAAHRQDYPKWATTIPDSSARQLVLLAAFPEADTYVSGFHDECLRNWQKRFRNDWHIYGERRWIFLQNRQNENQYLGTEDWLLGTTLNPLNDVQYVWNFSGPNPLVDLINDQSIERYWVSPNGNEVQGHGPPLNIAPVYKGVLPYDQTNNAFNTRLNFIATQHLRWHPHTLGEPPLAFLATNVKLFKGQADKCLLSVWVDSGHYAYRVRWDHGQDRWCLDLHTTNSVTTIRSTTATPDIEHEVYAFFGNGNAGIAVDGVVTSQAWTGNLQWPNGPFRIGGAGRGSVQWTDFAGCSLEKLTVWKDIPNGIPSGGFPWVS
jgi:hypothetical protein